ncbi:acyltransferase [Microbacterium esteraromaticum]|uniref:Acyltransferase n=1 Tax=Microbacterium esteraromaticum TaxID=57043 RepID=A0A7D7W8F3_9MICO|nr:acyltransferase [Microbacterium esteraromaticum]QMU97376.1 acyltransferase [Microbacterium esteraromaticum]
MRFKELDGLRGLAALSVVLYHFSGHYNTYYPQDPRPLIDIWWGAFGVQLFFLISGFVILMSADNARQTSDFVISRFSRLYPVYWVALIVGVAMGLIFAVPHVPLAVDVVVMNITMIQRWFLVPNVLDVFWTLAVEMQFYALLFALLVFTRCRLTEKLVVRVVLVWLMACLMVALWAFPTTHGVDPQAVPTSVKLIVNVLLASYGPLFCTGMLAFISRRNGRRHWLLLPSAVIAAVTTGLIEEWVNGGIVALICFGFIIVSLRKETRLLYLAPLQWLGKVSYSLYLIHSIVGIVVIHLLSPYIGRAAATILAFITVLFCAWLLWVGAEQFLSRRVRAWLLRARDALPRRGRPREAAHGGWRRKRSGGPQQVIASDS